MKKKELPPISLEEYSDVFLYPQNLHLTVASINQIINMHGFKKIHKTTKKVVIDALDAIELMSPSRSTLSNPVSSGKSMAVHEVLYDLNDLNWQECSVSSVQALNSSVESGFSIKPKIKKGRKALKQVINVSDLNEGNWIFVPRKRRSGLKTPESCS